MILFAYPEITQVSKICLRYVSAALLIKTNRIVIIFLYKIKNIYIVFEASFFEISESNIIIHRGKSNKRYLKLKGGYIHGLINNGF